MGLHLVTGHLSPVELQEDAEAGQGGMGSGRTGRKQGTRETTGEQRRVVQPRGWDGCRWTRDGGRGRAGSGEVSMGWRGGLDHAFQLPGGRAGGLGKARAGLQGPGKALLLNLTFLSP